MTDDGTRDCTQKREEGKDQETIQSSTIPDRNTIWTHMALGWFSSKIGSNNGRQILISGSLVVVSESGSLSNARPCSPRDFPFETSNNQNWFIFLNCPRMQILPVNPAG